MTSGCSHVADDCHQLLTCGNFDAGLGGSTASQNSSLAGSTAAATSSGGAHVGGTSGVGGIVSTGGTLNTGGVGTGGAPTCTPACSGAKPVCDLARLSCVECVSNANCPAPKGVCDTDNTCVQCLASTDCAAVVGKPACKADAKICVECVTSADCKDPSKAVCDTVSNACVGCLATGDCKDPAKPQCNGTTKSCVECLSNADCKTPGASRCDLTDDSPTENTCLPCSVNSDCSHVSGKGVCKIDPELDADAGAVVDADAGTQAGVCVQCTVDDETPCAGKSCNPATNACTTTVRGSRKTCQSCAADSECGDSSGAVDPNKRCVPMTFAGAPHGAGGYCLQTVSAGCSSPYAVAFISTSVSGAPSEPYCGINQAATTCEAVLDLASAKVCAADGDCGGG